MKKCFKCKKIQPIKDFYKHPRTKDGHLNKCKSCTKEDCRPKNGKHKRTCVICSKGFRTNLEEIKRGGAKYCSRACFYKANAGKGNYAWKDEKSYEAVHKWVYTELGSPKYCEHCKTTKAKVYHWSNKSGKYLVDVKDWQRLCVKCHSKYDVERRETITIKCLFCNKNVKTKNSRRKYCSSLCNGRHYRKNKNL